MHLASGARHALRDRLSMRATDRILLVAVGTGIMAAAAGCIQITSSSFSDHPFTVVTNVTSRGEIPPDVKGVEIENRHGAVRIIGVETGLTGWEWQLEVRARSEAMAQQVAAEAVCSAGRAGDRLRVAMLMPDRPDQYSFRSDLAVRVPKAFAVACRNRHGEVEIADADGRVEVANQHGAVQLRNLPGTVQAQTSYAALTATRTGPATLKGQHARISAEEVRGPLTAETSYGAITAVNIGGGTWLRNQHGAIELAHTAGNVDAHTSYSSLTIKGVQGDAVLANQHGRIEVRDLSGSVDARTSYASLNVTAAGSNLVCHNQHGPVQVRALSPAFTRLSASTSYAPLVVHLPASARPAVRAQTTHGEIDSDFPVLLKPHEVEAFSGSPPGVPRVSLENRHGAIRVVRD
jgi:hypothetical protein